MTEILSNEELKRRALFVPCLTKEALARWIRVYLGLSLPDCTVSEESNSNPMDLIWEIYDTCQRNDPAEMEKLSRMMSFASRDSMKTLGAAIIEVLMLAHLDRPTIHLAAILQQSKKAQEYVKNFFARPYLKDFIEKQNEREIEYVRYVHPATGFSINSKEWKNLPAEQQGEWTRKYNYVRIIVATMQSTNSQHSLFLCVDGDTGIRVKDKVRGSLKSIEKKVMEISPGDAVLSLNMNNGATEYRKVTNVYSKTDYTIRIVAECNRNIICTKDHPVFVLGRGFVQAGEIKVGDRLVEIFDKEVNAPVRRLCQVPDIRWGPYTESANTDRVDQMILGSLLGDACISKRPGENPYIAENHCIKQAEYLAWKRSVIQERFRTRENKSNFSGYTGEKQVGYTTGNSPLLLPYCDFKKTLSGIERLDALGLAVWYMDDGCSGRGIRISTECFSLEQNELLRSVLSRKFNIEVKVHKYTKSDGRLFYYLRGTTEAKRRLVEICSEYIHPSMAYKFDLQDHRRRCVNCGVEFWSYSAGRSPLRCGDVVCGVITQKRGVTRAVVGIEDAGERTVYDLTLDSNHTMIAGSLLAHQCVDECDLIPNPKAYEEAKMVPAPFEGRLPLTLLTSTRKFSYGLVQKELDAADETGLVVRHWNLIDVTEPCPPSRHLPDQPKVTIFRNDDDLSHVDESGYAALDPEKQKKYIKDEGFSGCVGCPLFSKGCRGRLATHQTSKTSLLKPIPHTINLFKQVSVDAAQAQLLCRKPGSDGLVYPYLDYQTHMLTAAQMAERITGERMSENFTKEELIQLAIAKGARFTAGLDWGFNHDFSVANLLIWGDACFVFDVISQSGLELDDKVLVSQRIKQWNPIIYPDPEAPADIKTFSRRGFRMKEWSKYPGSVKSGIEIVRMCLRPAVGVPTLFFLRDDPGCEYAFRRMAKYHFQLDSAGNVTDIPADDEIDICDAIRYGVMNTVAPKGKIRVEAPLPPPEVLPSDVPKQENWMQDIIRKHTSGPDAEGAPKVTIKKGKFTFHG